MDIRIEKGNVHGTVSAPPSKSYGHRMLICAALSQGVSTVKGISSSEDMLATTDCIKALGAEVSVSGDTYTLDGSGIYRPQNELPAFNCRESGSTLRFFVPVALALKGGGTFRGTERLIERGINIYEEIFAPLGIVTEKTRESITVRGSLRPGEYHVRGGVSSQFISGLMFALPLLDGDSFIHVIPPVESRSYIDITIDAMKQFGVIVTETSENSFYIKGGQTYTPQDVQVEGDWSNAAFLFAAGRLASRGGLTVTGLNPESIQGDRVCTEYFDLLENDREAVIDISDCPDLGPVLFAFAAAKGGGRFTGTQRLRIKESDRSLAMAGVLSGFGIKMVISENDIEVLPGELARPQKAAWSHNDHRIVMSLAVLMILTGGVISEAEAVNKSYPDFFADLESIGINIQKEE